MVPFNLIRGYNGPWKCYPIWIIDINTHERGSMTMNNTRIQELIEEIKKELRSELEQELREEISQEVKTLIAEKMREDGHDVEKIFRYTGIRLPEKRIVSAEYDAVAKQVAAEMLMRGLPIESVQMATQLPLVVIKELQAQYAGFFA